MTPHNRYWCTSLRRDGVPIPRWQQTTSGWQEGLLRMQEERDDITGRTLVVARIISVDRATDMLSPLRDARILLMDDSRMVINGMERDETRRRDVAQAWLLVQGRQEPKGKAELDAH